MSIENPPQSTINTTVGPLVTGVMIGQLLLGIVCRQVTSYYRDWDHDPFFLKSLVGVLFSLNLLLGIIDYHVLYRALVLHYGNYDGFDLQEWTMWSEPGLTAAVGCLCQVFFLIRVWKATRSLILMAVLSIFVLFAFGAGISVSVSFFHVQRFSALARIPLPISLWLVSTSVVDALIAAVLIVALLRTKTPFPETRAIITQLVQLSMETSAATAIVALLNLILYFAMIQTAYHLLPQFSMCRVYTLTVLVTLSSRDEIRTLMDSRSHVTLDGNVLNRGSVHINVNTTIDQDDAKSAGNWAVPGSQSDAQSDIELAESARVWTSKAGGPF